MSIETEMEFHSTATLTPTQKQFFHTVTGLLSKATSGHTVDVQTLKQLHELVLNSKVGRSHADTVAVMEHILPDLAGRLQSTPKQPVKIWLLEFIEQLVRFEPSTFIPTVLNIVTSMTAEENIAVVKKVLSISCSLFPQVYSWLLFHGHSWGAVHEHMFRTVEQLKDQCIALWKGPSEAIKPIVIKFLEIAILTLSNEKSAPPSRSSSGEKKDELRPFSLKEVAADHPVLTQAALKEDVSASLDALLNFEPTAATTFSSLLKTLSTLCKQRSLQLSERIVKKLSDFVDLIIMEEAQLTLLPSEQQVARVKKDLQACLIDVLKTQSFALPNFDAQQATLVELLTGLGADALAAEVVQVQNAKRAEHVKQQGATYAKEIARTETQMGTLAPSSQPTRPQALPVVSIMHQLDELSRLPQEYVVELVSGSLDRFVVPPVCQESFQAPDPSPVFLGFLEQCLTASFNFVRADTQQAQRQQFQYVAEIIREHSTEAINVLYPQAVTQAIVPHTPAVPTVVRTVVPPIPVPELGESACTAMSLSAFNRIASNRVASTVERAGETMLRHVILAKLATTNLLHPREYLCTVRGDANEAAEASQDLQTWSSSTMNAPQPLRGFLAGKLQDAGSGGYESVLNVLYSLLCIDPSSATIRTQLLQKDLDESDHDGQHESAFGEDRLEAHDEGEGAEEEKEQHDDSAMQDIDEDSTTSGQKHDAQAAALRERGFDEPHPPSDALLTKEVAERRELLKSFMLVSECRDKAAKVSYDEKHANDATEERILPGSLSALATVASCNCKSIEWTSKRAAVEHIVRKHAAEFTPSAAAKPDSTAMTDVSSAQSASSKRKREDGDETGVHADDSDQPDSKRAKSEHEGASDVPLPAPKLPEFAQHGTVEYGEAMELLLAELKEGSTIEAQQLYRKFLLDIPLLTPRVFASLDDWIYEPSRSVIGLSALRDLILYRPPVRQTSLDLLLGYTHKPPLPTLRNQAMRLVVNQLYNPNPHLRAPILQHANKMLDMLAQPEVMLQDLPEIIVNVIVPPVPVYDQIDVGPAPTAAKKEFPKTAPTPTTPAAGTGEPAVKLENPPPGTPALVSQTSTELDRRARAEAQDLKTRQEIANLIADAERRKKKFDRLVFVRSLREKERKLMEQQREERQKRRMDRVTRHMELFLSLCVHDPPMFSRLLQVYARCTSDFVRKCVHDQMPRVVRVLNRVAPEALAKLLEEETMANVQAPSESGSEPLVLHCLQLMTATSAPTVGLVQAATRMYQAKNSPRYLVPILSGLPLDAIRRFLPKIITLPVDELRQAFQKLLHSKPPSSMKASELLIALHLIQPEPRRRNANERIDPAQIAKEKKEDEDALDKRIIAATKLCFDDPESFPPEVLGVVLSQLSDHTPLPKLLMRTVMQSMMLHSSLKSFIVSNLLIKLINKHIYLSPVLWQGFLAAGNMLLPQSIPVLIQLPDQPFMAMMTNPKLQKMAGMLVQFIQSFPLQVRRSIRELVQQMQQDRMVQEMAQNQQRG